ncbi:RING-H2 finger protein ATL70-like [Magnolia sinica]|uniref:RING-H2 finger protein ATL70-like n=1 Tax=Magnolia sinica TaxID=86752 RepID=UPI0026584064|nr:RING-H2 finger protein ATL70-like [Magnolia sinica]
MNSTYTSDGLMNTDMMSRSGLSYGIGLTIGILFLLITTITVATYICTRPSSSPIYHSRELHGPTQHQTPVADNKVGLDEATLLSYPMLLYSHVKIQNKNTNSSCCPICLADYKDTDMLRLLPDCRHLFHVKCVDAWLLLHPTCPVCRTPPLPTPLAEVVPLARQV